MKGRFFSLLVLSVISSVALSGCSPKIKTQRLSTADGDKKAMSMTDEWLMTDTTNAITDIIKQMQNHRGYQAYLARTGKATPKIFIAEIQNNTSEAYFPIEDMNDELLNEFSASGEFILIDEKARTKILKEIKYQNDGMVDSKEAKSIGKQSGADLLIFGNVNMKPVILGGQTLKEYSVNIRMTDISTGVEVLRTRYKISKYSKRSGMSW